MQYVQFFLQKKLHLVLPRLPLHDHELAEVDLVLYRASVHLKMFLNNKIG